LAIIQEQGGVVGGSPELRSSSQSYLDQAIEIDPDFAMAYVERARVLVSLLNQDPGIHEDYASQRAEREGLALRDLRQALALDPGAGAAHGMLARIHQFNWRGSEAREAYDRALELTPNDSEMLMDYAGFCAVTGRSEQALEFGKRSIALDPNSATRHQWLGFALSQTGDQDRAVEAFRRSVELSPAFGLGHLMLGSFECTQGNHDEALKQAQIAEQFLRDGLNPVLLAELSNIYARLEHHQDAERIFRRLEEMAETHRIPATAWILGYMALGDDKSTLRWLNEAADSPEPYVGYFGLLNIKANAFASPVLDQPRFREVRERLGYRD